MKVFRLIEVLLGCVVLAALPAILLLDEPSLSKYAVLYIALMLPLVLISTWLVVNAKEIPMSSMNARIVVVVTILFPFAVFAAYPFHVHNVLITIALACFGAGLPYWSRRTTLWFYTFGNLFPLPKQHSWLLGKDQSSRGSVSNYINSIKNASSVGLVIGLIAFHLIRSEPVAQGIQVMRVLGLFIVFGLSLTIATEIRGRSFVKSR